MTELLNEDDLISYTQRIRHQLAEDITQQGKTMPTDKEDRMILLATLDGISKTALGKKRIQSNDEGNKNTAAAIAAIDALSARFGNVNPLRNDAPTGSVKSLDKSRLPDIELVPGITDIGVSTQTYEEFTADRQQS